MLATPKQNHTSRGCSNGRGFPIPARRFPRLSLARAKHTTKHLLKGAGLPTADFMAVHGLPMPKCSLAFPVIVKPATQDASVGMDQASVCVNPSALKRRVQYILATYGAPVIVEEYIPGRELNVSLVELPELTALPAAEIVLPREKAGQWSIYTYDGKWKADSSEYAQTSVRMATDLSAAMVRKLNRLAMSAYRLLGCRDYGRVDFRLQADGKAYILEVNPNPDISEQADLTDFLVRLVNQAHSRRHTPKPTFARQALSSGISTVMLRGG